MKKISKPNMTAKRFYQKPALYHPQNSLLFTNKITIMRKLLLPFLAVLLFTACQKQIINEKEQKAPEGMATIAHLKAGECLDLLGKRDEAIAEYRIVLNRRDALDSQDQARKYIKTPYVVQ